MTGAAQNHKRQILVMHGDIYHIITQNLSGWLMNTVIYYTKHFIQER
jgi:hypothetical protein